MDSKVKKKKWRVSLPLKLIIVVVLCLIFGNSVGLEFKRFAYTISLNIKSLLVFVLPLIIFSFIFSCMIGLKRGAILFVLLLLVVLTCSNMLSTMIAYGVSNASVGYFNNLFLNGVSATDSLIPLWNLTLPTLVPNEYALFGGFVLGGICSYFQWGRAILFGNKLKEISHFLLERCLIPVVPLFILGFVLQFQHQKILGQIFEYYGGVLAIILATQLGYVLFLYGLGVGFNPKKWYESLRNVFPSAVAGLSAMSSIVALPLTMRGAERNSGDPDLADAVVPATVNIHLIGDCLWIPIMALGMMHSYGVSQPSFAEYLIFAVFFVLAKFAVAAVPAGGIIVMLPILEKYLGFTPEMLSLIFALYVLFDATTTMVNVLGNGAFAVLFIKGYRKVFSLA